MELFELEKFRREVWADIEALGLLVFGWSLGYDGV